MHPLVMTVAKEQDSTHWLILLFLWKENSLEQSLTDGLCGTADKAWVNECRRTRNSAKLPLREAIHYTERDCGYLVRTGAGISRSDYKLQMTVWNGWRTWERKQHDRELLMQDKGGGEKRLFGVHEAKGRCEWVRSERAVIISSLEPCVKSGSGGEEWDPEAYDQDTWERKEQAEAFQPLDWSLLAGGSIASSLLPGTKHSLPKTRPTCRQSRLPCEQHRPQSCFSWNTSSCDPLGMALRAIIFGIKNSRNSYFSTAFRGQKYKHEDNNHCD